MLVTLSRILRYGWQGFLRNGSLSISTISIMILAAVVFEGLILFNVMGQIAIQSIQEKIDVSVYFKSNTSEDTILSIKKSLENLSEVKSVVYVSRDEALEVFKARHAGEETITQTLDELETNPLLASLNVKAYDPREYSAIADYLQKPELQNVIEKIDYAQNEVVIARLIALIDTMKKGGIALTLFLSFLAVIVTFNTIRLAIFSSSEQLNIMRLVGASNSFIRGPYIVEGIGYGVIAAVVSFFLMMPFVNFISPYLIKFIPEINLLAYLRQHMVPLFLYQLAFCTGLGILSSIIAVRRHLHI